MAHYIGYFLEGGDQLIALVAVGLVWLGMTALGAAVGGRARVQAVDHLVGWALVSLFFTLVGVFFKPPFTALALAAGVAAVGAGVFAWRRDRTVLTPGIGRVFALGLPLLVLAGAMHASQWDEFSDWLMIPRYMLELDHFPSRERPFSQAVFTGYPYSWHYIGYLAGRIGGGLLESAGAISNVILLFGYALLMTRLMIMGAGRHPDGERVTWPLAAVAVLLVSMLNPTFAQKIVLTSYADTASAVVTGAASVLAWMVLDALAGREFDRARRLALSMGLVLAVLINLKQSTLVLVLLVVLATTFIAMRDPAVPFRKFLRVLPAMVLPAAVLFLTWRYHLSSEMAGRELKVSPFDAWLIHLIPQILLNMLTVLAKKGAYLAAGVVVVGFGLVGFWRARTSMDRLAALCAMVFLGYNAFLLFAYVTTFGEFDALRVASFWRYNMHLGFVVVAFIAYGLGMLWQRAGARRPRLLRWSWLPVALVLAAPFVFAHKLRFDRAPWTAHFRAVGAEMANLIPQGANVFVADPAGSGESSVIMRYEMRDRGKLAGYVSAFFPDRLTPVRDAAGNEKVTSIIVFSNSAGYAELFGTDLPPGRSHLLERGSGGGWRIVKSWPSPAQ